MEALVEAKVYTWSQDGLVSLYQKLFIAQSALCELYFHYEEEGQLYLHLTPIDASLRKRRHSAVEPLEASAELEPSAHVEPSAHMEPSAPLGSAAQQTPAQIVLDEEGLSPNVEFFSDERNFLNVTAEDVKHLLESFWTRYQAHFSQSESLAILELEYEQLCDLASPSTTQEVIRLAYRKAAAKYHPDRGGDSTKFIAVRQAYERLRSTF